MATFSKFNSFVEALAHGVHDLSSDQLVIALTDGSHAPVAANTVLGNLTQVGYDDCSTRNITKTSSGQTGGTYKLVLVDLVLTSSGTVGPFQYVVIYNDDAATDELVAFFDYGEEITLNSGETLTINFDDSNGLFQLV